MVVVSDAALVESGRTGGLDAPQESLFHKGAKGIVNRLFGNTSYFRANLLRNCVRSAVRPCSNCPENSQSLGGYRDAMSAKKFPGFDHRALFVSKVCSKSSFRLSPI